MSEAYNVKRKYPEFLKDIDDMSELEGLSMSERRRWLGQSALEGFAVAEASDENPFQHIEDVLKNKIIGQPKAIETIADVLTRESMHNPNQPIATLMFLGQTGTGKTETAKLLADLINDSDDPEFDNFIRIDCTDFKKDHMTNSLLGAPLGYKGSDKKPRLSNEVLEGGKTVILFDEIEKAHESLHDLMLHIIDDGVLETHGEKSEKVFFDNSIIIMTSNLGGREMAKMINGNSTGFGPNLAPIISDKQIESAAKNEMKEVFKSEFIGRISNKVIFRGFDDAQLGEIVDARVEQENGRYRSYGYDLTISEKLRDYIVAETDDRRELNARSVLKKYEGIVETEISKHYLMGTIPRGSDVYVDLDENNKVVCHHRWNPQLSYEMDEDEPEDEATAVQMLELTAGESDDRESTIVYSAGGDGVEEWTYDGDMTFVNGKRIFGLSDLLKMYEVGEVSAETAFELAMFRGWLPDTTKLPSPDQNSYSMRKIKPSDIKPRKPDGGAKS